MSGHRNQVESPAKRSDDEPRDAQRDNAGFQEAEAPAKDGRRRRHQPVGRQQQQQTCHGDRHDGRHPPDQRNPGAFRRARARSVRTISSGIPPPAAERAGRLSAVIAWFISTPLSAE